MSPDPVSNVDAAETAVVTGASGYVATELIKQLLSKGYNVRGTVRSLASKDKVSHLLKLNEVSLRCRQTGHVLFRNMSTL